MQQGMLIIGSLLGIRHFKWEANANRKAGEMLTLYICPKTEGGTLDAEPCSISVPSENVPSALGTVQKKKQFDTVVVSVQQVPGRNGERDRLMYRCFYDLSQVTGAK